jgi:tetratricopeptide (TPR) repeat protein
MRKRAGKSSATVPAPQPQQASPLRAPLAARLLDGLLLVLLVVVAVLLGCYEMGDTDVWWHLRGGQWTLEHGRPPDLDPFTFGSADKPWIDIHWLYEVVLALAYRAGGVSALVLLAAAVGGLAFLAVVCARRRQWPAAVAVFCWLPALVLFAFRLDPRPEIFSLLYLGCFLAVLWRAEERPVLAWLLVPLQLLWVNMQGLFVLGPVLLVMFLAARGARLLWQRIRPSALPLPASESAPGGVLPDAEERRWWKHVGGATAAVVVACLVNPYFLDGARFPFDLYPKVTEAGNPYKKYIDELQSAHDFVSEATPRVAGGNWFFLSCYFLMLLLPVSFLYPALWRAWRAADQPPRPATWHAGLAGVVGLLALNTLTLSGRGPGWLVALGDNVPLLLLGGGAAAAILLGRRAPATRVLAGVAGVGLALLILWLQGQLLGQGRGLLSFTATDALPGEEQKPTTKMLLLPLIVVGLWLAGEVLSRGGNLFRALVAGAFAYLALQALQNWTRFALAAGAVLSWNFGEWAAEVARAGGGLRTRAAWGLRIGLAGVLGLWVTLLATDRYYSLTGEVRHFSLREEPLAFAHDAVKFAGRPGLPERAVVFGLGQTGLYDFYNAPRCKPFMDGRLEMPDRRTFETYVNLEDWLRLNDPRWQQVVADMGWPLILLEHTKNHGAEAALLAHPGWRCVYFDALAAVFVPRGKVDETAFPTVDFAARHFAEPAAASIPAVRGAARRELKALFNLAATLPRTPQVAHLRRAEAWRWRIPLLLAALDRGRLALEEKQAEGEVWMMLGTTYWNLLPDLGEPPPTPAAPWNLERGIFWAQATYCLRRASDEDPGRASIWDALARAYGARNMADAWLTAKERWLETYSKVTGAQRREIAAVRERIGRGRLPHASPEQTPALAVRLMNGGRPLLAARLLEDAERRETAGWDWAFAERVAGLYMHLGRPADARRVWEQARNCPSQAARLCRLAATFWVERDFDTALRLFEQARKADPKLPDACWGLAVLRAQLGKAQAALDACDAALQLTLTPGQRSDLEGWRRLLLAQRHP